MTNNLVSIIVLTYKDFTKIERTLESCCRQNYEKIEIIVRDDGSPDFEKEIIENILSKYSNRLNYKILHDEINKGTVINFNEAIQHSSGEYIVVVSGDDYLKKSNAITEIVKMFNKNKRCMCVTSRERHIWPDGREVILPSPYEEFAIKHFSCRKLWYLISARPCFIVGSATSYRRAVFEKIGMFDTNYRLLEDWPFYLKLFENNMQISFLPYETIYHASGGVSTSNGISRNKMLVRDDLKCINYAINHAETMRLSRWEKKSLIFRRDLLENELSDEEKCLVKKENYLLMIIWRVCGKLKNLSLRIDFRKILSN